METIVVVLGFLGSVVSAVLLAAVLLLDCTGCGPKQVPMPSIHERCQAAPRPDVCEVIGMQVAADEATGAPTVQAVPPQRVFVRRWLVPGGRNSPAPLGYIDY